MNFHLTFEFDHNRKGDLTEFLDKRNITYNIVEHEISIEYMNLDQITELLELIK